MLSILEQGFNNQGGIMSLFRVDFMANGEQAGTASADTTHWQFFRAGDFEQVMIRFGADLQALEQLDKKLWAALSCPVHGLEFDTRTLALIDSDGDDRIRVPEILQAIRFSQHLLKSLDVMVDGGYELPLDQIDDSHEDGQRVRASAQRILKTLGRGEHPTLSVNDVIEVQAAVAKLPFNGDGIVPPAVAEDGATRKAMEEIIACVGGEPDRNGELGLSTTKLDIFFTEAQARLTWLDEAQELRASVLPLGDATAQAFAALQAVQGKIEDFFVRCRMAAYDARAALPLNPAETDYAALAMNRLTAGDEALATFPMATVKAGGVLPLMEGVNPAWGTALEQFRVAVVVPLLGANTSLSESQWREILARLAPHAAWHAKQPGAALERLDEHTLRQLAAGDAKARIAALIEQDLVLKPEIEAIGEVERLVRYVRDLSILLRNYVSFADFYSGKHKAIFQAGTLYIDQRSCDLCIRVDDIGKHSALATLSRTYLVYCECRRRGGSEKMTIAAAITAGDEGGLMVGRNGLFIDRQGQDWDATVVKVIEHPISIRQAFLAPYKRLARFIGTQMEKLASSRATGGDERLAAGAEGAAQTAGGGKPPAPPFDVAKFAGIFAAIGLAIGAIGTAVVALVSGLFSLPWWQIPLVIAGGILAISGFSMLLAWLKLRQRNLAPLLDANGWAVNTRARINIPFGTSLTALAVLPPGSERPLGDPFAEKRFPWEFYLLGVVLFLGAIILYLAWRSGLVR